MATQLHTYCAMCTSRCGVIATVDDGRLTQVNADPDHPNGCICVKGSAAPEIVYSPDRIQFPMARTRPKGDPDPGWIRITWEQALNLAALRLNEIKDNYGAEAVVFSRATTAGSAAIDFDGWLQRLANAFGSPNLLTSNHICTWNRRVGAKYTYGIGMPLPDFDNTECMLIWGINPPATSPAQAVRINRARNRGAKLIVIDPRRTTLAAKAESWLRVRPGKDGELAMAMIHVLLEENLFDAEFARSWTNAAFLVRDDDGHLLTERDLIADGDPQTFYIHDEESGRMIAYRAQRSAGFPTRDDNADKNVRAPIESSIRRAALFGAHNVTLVGGDTVTCRPAFELLKQSVAPYAPERSETITTVPAEEVRNAVRLFAKVKPSTYCTWVGLEQDNDAMQTNRAVCIFYALTGQYDQRGSNVLFATTLTNPITGREHLPKEKAQLRLGRDKHPLGPPVDPGLVQAAEVYDAILTEKPYSVKAMVLFGTDPLLGYGDPLRGKAAFEALDFYVHVDTTINPSANFADLILPATTCWEREALLPSFEIAEDTLSWAQLRPAVAKPVGESRSEVEIIFDLANRMGLSQHFFDGDIEAAYAHQLAPSGLTTKQLRANPVGMRAPVITRYEKYAEIDSLNEKPRGFDTPTGKIEIYATTFAEAGYPPLPQFETSDQANDQYPLTLTFFRDIHFCDEQHRNIPRLRRAVPEPFIEIHPNAAEAKGIAEGEWIFLETKTGRVKLKVKYNDSLHPNVVTTVYGWWQACQELNLTGHDPFSQNGANTNLLIPNSDNDAISASVAHRGQRCRVIKQ
ncbi:MAG: molybdopterin oxidoreductase [Deltaproteobacteria bacterium]|nr:molybdopterin oxidoreductase [Deltaproteobacteria bacterium]